MFDGRTDGQDSGEGGREEGKRKEGNGSHADRAVFCSSLKTNFEGGRSFEISEFVVDAMAQGGAERGHGGGGRDVDGGGSGGQRRREEDAIVRTGSDAAGPERLHRIRKVSIWVEEMGRLRKRRDENKL